MQAPTPSGNSPREHPVHPRPSCTQLAGLDRVGASDAGARIPGKLSLCGCSLATSRLGRCKGGRRWSEGSSGVGRSRGRGRRRMCHQICSRRSEGSAGSRRWWRPAGALLCGATEERAGAPGSALGPACGAQRCPWAAGGTSTRGDCAIASGSAQQPHPRSPPAHPRPGAHRPPHPSGRPLRRGSPGQPGRPGGLRGQRQPQRWGNAPGRLQPAAKPPASCSLKPPQWDGAEKEVSKSMKHSWVRRGTGCL